jgi:HEAT repeats
MAENNRPRTYWAFRLSIVTLGLLFALTLWQRDRLRAHWWASRLVATEDLNLRGRYLAGLISLGPKASEAIRRLSRDDRAEVRCLSVYALQSLANGQGVGDLSRLVGDSDQAVRDAAATGLALMQRDDARDALCELARKADEATACAAAAGLARIEDPVALATLCETARRHRSPLVRVHAIESLVDLRPTPASTDSCDLCTILAEALADRAEFSGALALERQRLAAEGFAFRAAVGRPTSPGLVDPKTLSSPGAVFRPINQPEKGLRTVAQYAASSLSALTGQSADWVGLARQEVVAKCRSGLHSPPGRGPSSQASAMEH